MNATCRSGHTHGTAEGAAVCDQQTAARQLAIDGKLHALVLDARACLAAIARCMNAQARLAEYQAGELASKQAAARLKVGARLKARRRRRKPGKVKRSTIRPGNRPRRRRSS